MKINNYLKVATCYLLLCFTSSFTFAQANLIVNPSFEFGQAPNTGNGLGGFKTGMVNNWLPGFVANSTGQGGSADVLDYSFTGNCAGAPPNIAFDPLGGSFPYREAHEGIRFARMYGAFVDDGVTDQESVLGELNGPICAGTYTISYWAGAIGHFRSGNCGSGSTALTSINVNPNTIIEVLLWNTDDLSIQPILIHTSTLLVKDQWNNYSASFTITQAEATNEYNSIEFRINEAGHSADGLKHVMLDDLSLVQTFNNYPTSSSSSTISCTATSIDLDGEVTCDGTLADWHELYVIEPLPSSIVRPDATTTYQGFCINAYGCATYIEHTINVNSFTETSEDVELCHDDHDYNIDLSALSSNCTISPMTNVTQNSSCNYTLDPADGSTYVVRWEDGNGNCFKKTFNFSRIGIVINNNPVEITVCQYESYTLIGDYCSGLGANSYTWSQGLVTYFENSPVSAVGYNIGTEYWQLNCYKDGCFLGSQSYNVNVLPNNKIDYGLDPEPILLCDNDVFAPTFKCTVPNGATVVWYDEYGNIKTTDPVTNGLVRPYVSSTGIARSPQKYTRKVTGPGQCQECIESYTIQWKMYTSYQEASVNLNYSPNATIECIEDHPEQVYQFSVCDDCFEVPLYQHTNTIKDFPSRCSWARVYLPNNDPLQGFVRDNSTSAMTGFSYNPATGSLTICPNQLNILSGSPNECTLVQYCYQCEGTYADCPIAGEVCMRFHLKVEPCKKGYEITTSVESDWSFDNDDKTKLEIYPNPSEGIFTLELAGYNLNEVSYVITDALGREVYTSDNVTSETTEINLSNLSKGVYLMRLKYMDAIITKRIVIQ